MRHDPAGRPNVLITSASRKVLPRARFQGGPRPSGGGSVVATDLGPLAAALHEADGAGRAALRRVRLRRCAEEALRGGANSGLSSRPGTRSCRSWLLPGMPSPRTGRSCSCPRPRRSRPAATSAGSPKRSRPPGWTRRAPTRLAPPRCLPSSSRGSARAARCDSGRHAAELATALAAAGPDAIVQELMDAPEYTVDLFLDLEGRPIHACPASGWSSSPGSRSSRARSTIPTWWPPRSAWRRLSVSSATSRSRLSGRRSGSRSSRSTRATAGPPISASPRGHRTAEYAIRLARGEPLEPRIGEHEVGLVMLRAGEDRFVDEADLRFDEAPS